MVETEAVVAVGIGPKSRPARWRDYECTKQQLQEYLLGNDFLGALKRLVLQRELNQHASKM